MITQATTVGLLPKVPMVTSYDAPARPQHWQLHKEQGVGVHFIAFYTNKSKLSDVGEWFAKKYQEKFNEPPVYAALNAFANALVFAQAIEMAKTTEPKAMIKALENGSFKGWSVRSGYLPAGGRIVVAQLVAAADDPQIHQARADAVRGRGRLYARRELKKPTRRCSARVGNRKVERRARGDDV